ncbi:hypothetical protein QAD02_012310 [Eretmocerus hayati]|uniref:Uncharacterized protein n=1 Tax=Eretmocerus hayati TaxID=131215 RepID=A0ACC2NZ96_9HYME|nr:hypothetical protein QAD02_012310 [Eretmocerus hayati]
MANSSNHDDRSKGFDEGRSNRARERERDLLFQTFTNEKANRYDKDSNGPFLVHTFDTEGNLGNYHISEFGRTLYKANIPVIDLYRAGPMRYAIKFETGELANKFVESQVHLVNNRWRAFIPDTGLYKIGLVHRVSKDITEQDILEGLDPDSRAVIRKVERIFSTVDSNKGRISYATDKIKIYAINHLPRSIRLFRSIYRDVEYFVPAVLRCYNCQRYGHGASVCRNVGRCLYCSHNHSGTCRIPTKCPNCRKNHPASDRECIFFIFNSEVNFVMSQKKVCRAEAISMVQENYKRKFKENFGKDISDVLYEGPNPYINKRDLFEQRGLFIFDEDSCPEQDDGILPDPEPTQRQDPSLTENVIDIPPSTTDKTPTSTVVLHSPKPTDKSSESASKSPSGGQGQSQAQHMSQQSNEAPTPSKLQPKSPTDHSTSSEFDIFENRVNKSNFPRGPIERYEYENGYHPESYDNFTPTSQSRAPRESRPRYRGNSSRSRSPRNNNKRFTQPTSERENRYDTRRK